MGGVGLFFCCVVGFWFGFGLVWFFVPCLDLILPQVSINSVSKPDFIPLKSPEQAERGISAR